MPRAKKSVLTVEMLPPHVQPYVPKGLADSDLPLWYAAFETGRSAQTGTSPPEKSPPRTPAAKLPAMPIPEPSNIIEMRNYGDPEDADDTLDGLLGYARQARPQIDSARLAEIAPQHDEIAKWLKAKSLPSGRVMDGILDNVIERTPAVLKTAAQQ